MARHQLCSFEAFMRNLSAVDILDRMSPRESSYFRGDKRLSLQAFDDYTSQSFHESNVNFRYPVSFSNLQQSPVSELLRSNVRNVHLMRLCKDMCRLWSLVLPFCTISTWFCVGVAGMQTISNIQLGCLKRRQEICSRRSISRET